MQRRIGIMRVQLERGRRQSPSTSTRVHPPPLATSSHHLRPRKKVNYIEDDEPDADGFIWCSTCNRGEYSDMNMLGFQLAGQIFYRVLEDIPNGKELLVWYGDEYARMIGIKLEVMGQYKLKEDHLTEAVKCHYCSSGMGGEEELKEHQGKARTGSYRCGKKQAMEMIRMARTGERKSGLYMWKGISKTKATETSRVYPH